MRWNVEGADGKTGEEHVYSIDADTAAEAEQKARAKGILVSAVHKASMQPRDEQGATLMSRAGIVPPSPGPSPDTPPVPYRASATSLAHAPDYVGRLRALAQPLFRDPRDELMRLAVPGTSGRCNCEQCHDEEPRLRRRPAYY